MVIIEPRGPIGGFWKRRRLLLIALTKEIIHRPKTSSLWPLPDLSLEIELRHSLIEPTKLSFCSLQFNTQHINSSTEKWLLSAYTICRYSLLYSLAPSRWFCRARLHSSTSCSNRVRLCFASSSWRSNCSSSACWSAKLLYTREFHWIEL